jgi:hypothetical protein
MTLLDQLQTERDRIEAQIATLDEGIVKIKSQLEHSDADGNPDRHWRADATCALRFKNRKRQELSVKLSRINKAINIEIAAENDRRFTVAAKRRLPAELFDTILSESNVVLN